MQLSCARSSLARHRQRPRLRSPGAAAALAALVVSLLSPASAKPLRVEVSMGAPQARSLADAHYLLEDLKGRSEQLSITGPGALDPSAVNRRRLEILQTMVELNASSSGITAAQNAAVLDDRQRSLDRRAELEAEQAALRARGLQVVRALSEAQTAKTRREKSLEEGVDPASDPEVIVLEQEIAGLRAEQAEINAQLGWVDTSLQGLSVGSLSGGDGLQDPSVPNSSSNNSPVIPNESTQAAITAFLSGQANDVANHFSIDLTNYISAEYELISRKLSLLRAQLGENYELVFIELPQAIVHVVPGRGDDYLVRTHWSIANPDATACTTAQATRREHQKSVTGGADGIQMFRRADVEESCPKSVRILEVIPHQNALSAEETVGKGTGFSLGLAFKKIFGLGADATIDRRRQQFNRARRQDVFASGYGKGRSEFGWVFSPIPGTSRLAAGEKTTYAVAVVPRGTRELSFTPSWCAFHKKVALDPAWFDAPPPDSRKRWCRKGASETAQIRHAGDSFWVDELFFSSVPSGQLASVYLHGDSFPEDVRVLVNNAPLEYVAHFDDLDAMLAAQAGRTVQGVFQRPSRDLIHMIVRIGGGYTGTPLIALNTPRRDTVLNFLPLEINGQGVAQLRHYGLRHPMFRPPFALASATVSVESSRVAFLVNGSGFVGSLQAYINGESVSTAWRTENQALLHFPRGDSRLSASSYRIVLRQRQSQGFEERSTSVSNPLYATFGEARVVDFDTAANRLYVTIPVASDARTIEARTINGASLVGNPVTTVGGLNLVLEPSGDSALISLGSRILSRDLALVHVTVPREPSIQSMDKSEGAAAGGYQVVIEGRNLGQVRSVHFGAKPAAIRQRSATLLQVEVPPGKGVVPVVLETGTRIDGVPLSNLNDLATDGRARFTYK